MILEIIISITFFSLVYFTSIGYGLLLNKIIIKDKSNQSIGEIGINGLFFLSFISLFLHFFSAINQIITSIVCVFGIVIFVLFKKNKIIKFDFKNFLIFLILFPSIIFFEYHADYFWYQLPYINITNEYKIIFGLSNINDFLGYGHLWYDILAIFTLPYFDTYYSSLIAIVFLFFFLIILKDTYFLINIKIIRIFILLTTCFIFLIYSNAKDYGSEIQVNLIYLLISLQILIYKFDNKKFSSNQILKKIIILFFFAVLIRSNSIIFIPLVIVFSLLNYKQFINIFFNEKIFLFFILIFSFLYILKNFIISGCLSYPIYWSCFDYPDWSIGFDQAKLRFNHLSAQSKGYLVWLLNENYINNIFDYYKFREKDTFVSPEYYLTNINWIKYWWLYEYDVNRFLNIFYFFVIFTSLIIITNFKKIYLVKIKNDFYSYVLYILLFSICVISWVILLPQTRYGGYAILFVFLCFISLLIINHIKKINLISLYLLIFISVGYYGSKNYDRIINNYILFDMNIYENFYSYPKVDTQLITTYNKNKIKITEKKLETKRNFGHPLFCYNIKGLCGSVLRLECINEIKYRKGYIFIIPNKKKCSSLIDNYLWY